MSSSRVKEIKQEDKKAFRGFAIVLVISLIVGGFFGAMSGNVKGLLGDVPSLLINMLESITPFASLILSLLVIIVSWVIYTNARKQYSLWKEANDDNDTIDKIEEKLAIVIAVTCINNIIGFFFFGIATMLLPFDNAAGNLSSIKLLSSFIGFVLCISSSILIQKSIINFEKEINPLLKGSIYDTKFTEKWVDSCDESIKLGIYKSAYKAYASVSKTFPILWILCIVGYDLWDFGIAPMVIVTIIWLVQTISYSIESIKYNKRK